MKKESLEESLKQNFEPYLKHISNETIKTYIEHRILKQIAWYDKKSKRNQLLFKRWMLASIILNTFIPLLVLFNSIPCAIIIKALITLISSSTTAISAIISLYHFQELWIQYRTNCELLQSILHRYFTQSDQFEDSIEEESFNHLVEKCEQYMTNEFESWTKFQHKYLDS